eukprot:TRINITY_DN54996_c0_g1_i1.p1 TRINITY_DN54996_c0_g1~~TRINITY_DN54996_c0_g1_i1.p1  ORF type:complete len:252 (-),score=6.35 TRINITY_DN54996_c0_g1_i1:62-709(-)
MSPARGTVSRSSGLEVGRRSCGKSVIGSAGPTHKPSSTEYSLWWGKRTRQLYCPKAWGAHFNRVRPHSLQAAHDLLAIPPDVYRFTPPSNITTIGMVLEKLTQFSTPAIVGLSVGAGSILILGFCIVGWCSWMCGFKNCTASPRESFTRSPPPSPTSDNHSPTLPVAAQPPRRNQPITVKTGPLVSSDSEVVADQTLDYLRQKVKSLSALRNNSS